MKTKLISIILATVLMSETSYAAAGYLDGIMDHSLMNVTPGGKIVEKDAAGNVKSTSFTTTSVYFRFGPGLSYPEPIFNVSPPQISAGCNGLSIKGMFASIISLTQMEEQLKNAGASIAWGIVVGLIYSLPGIGAAFRMIDTWAKKIQQLLANACQMGQQIAQFAVKESGIKDNTTIKEIAAGASNLVDKLEFPKGIQDTGLGFKFDFDNMAFPTSTDTKSPEDIKDSWKMVLIGALTSQSLSTNVLSSFLIAIPNGSRLDFIKQAYHVSNISEIKPFMEATFSITLNNTNSATVPVQFNLTTLLNNSGLDSLTQDDMARSFTQAAVSRSLSGDLLRVNTDVKQTMDYVAVLTDPLETPEAKKIVSAHLSESITSSNASTIATFAPDTLKTPANELASLITRYLAFGVSDKGLVGNETIPVNALTYTITAIPGNLGDNSIIFILSATSANKVANNANSWFKTSPTDKGAVERSRILIEGLTTPQPVAVSLDDLLAQAKIGLLVPGIAKKIKVIQQTPESQRRALIELLIDYNAYHTVLGSIDGFTSGGRLATPLRPTFLLKNGTLVKNELGVSMRDVNLNLYSTTVKDASADIADLSQTAKFLLNDLFEPMNSTELDAKFKAQDLINRQEAVKEAPGK